MSFLWRLTNTGTKHNFIHKHRLVVLSIVLCSLQPLVVVSESSPEIRLENSSSSTVVTLVILGSVCALIIFIVFGIRRRLIAVDKNRIPDVYDPEIARAEASLVETLDEAARQNYERARIFQEAYPPDSVPTDITLSQFLSIQEKGVSAWEFEPDLQHTNCFVECRTEIAFYDAECCVQTNLPLPKQQEVYYWEAKMYDKPPNTTVAVGLATKPYPLFRLPGWNRQSVAYFSDNGFKYYNSPFNVGANGPCCVHVNFGQLGFVFIEANVKKWGLAPSMGTLAPPPAYGSERGSLLLESSSRGHPSEDVSRQFTHVNSGIITGVPPEAALDISLVDITVPPPSYSSTDQYYGRQSFMSDKINKDMANFKLIIYYDSINCKIKSILVSTHKTYFGIYISHSHSRAVLCCEKETLGKFDVD
ncbi:endosomal SPRY domain protein, putative [Rhizophagus clarus]|uniref:Endosomal SPRY domain protein, putative n=1 Tax=Rhizophagus clarus TaxID=94130 RepID=A0A8H3QFD3_9GLOM|nr:endosomal SPRY domain protein, putative [Rhizophagus clarus]